MRDKWNRKRERDIFINRKTAIVIEERIQKKLVANE